MARWQKAKQAHAKIHKIFRHELFTSLFARLFLLPVRGFSLYPVGDGEEKKIDINSPSSNLPAYPGLIAKECQRGEGGGSLLILRRLASPPHTQQVQVPGKFNEICEICASGKKMKNEKKV